jgi:hypothetical protein
MFADPAPWTPHFPAVVAVDNSAGFHHASTGTFVVRTPTEAAHVATTTVADGVRLVRAMPLHSGRPLGVDVLIGDRTTFLGPPIEHLTFNEPSSGRMHFLGAASVWSPAKTDLAAINSVVRKVAKRLHDTFGLRGAITVDGVLVNGTFHLTEVNARCQGSLQNLARRFDEFDLALFSALLRDPTFPDTGIDRFADWFVRQGKPTFLHMWLRTAVPAPGDEVHLVCGPNGEQSQLRPPSYRGPAWAAARWFGHELRVVLAPEMLPSGLEATEIAMNTMTQLGRHFPLDLLDLVAVREGSGATVRTMTWISYPYTTS